MGLCHVVRKKAECWEVFGTFSEGKQGWFCDGILWYQFLCYLGCNRWHLTSELVGWLTNRFSKYLLCTHLRHYGRTAHIRWNMASSLKELIFWCKGWSRLQHKGESDTCHKLYINKASWEFRVEEDGFGLAQWRGLIGEIREDFVEDGAGSWLLEDG